MSNAGHRSVPVRSVFRFDLQDKLALGIAAVFTIAAAAGLTLVQRMVTGSIEQMDEQAALREASRVISVLTGDIVAGRHAAAATEAGTGLTDEDLQAIGRRTGLFLAAFDATDRNLDDTQRRALEVLRRGEEVFMDRLPADQWVAYWLVKMPADRPPVVMRATIRSPQSEEVAVTMQYAGILLLGLAAVVLIALIGMVRWMVVRPIATLTRNVSGIGSSADLSKRVSLDQDDEIGALSREFDRMLDQLASAQRSLMAYSFQAGAHGAAVQALHDIGNAATPVTVSLELLRENLDELRTNELVGRLDLIAAESDPSKREQRLLALKRDMVALSDGVARVREQLAATVRHSGRIESILRSADRGSHPLPGPETIAPRDLVATAVAMLRPDDREGVSIELDGSLGDIPRIKGAHPGLYAVFHAVLINAVEAVRASGAPGSVLIKGSAAEGDAVRITVTDTGIGILPADLPRIFEREFSTKNRPKSMFSLHWCASILSSSGGSMTAQSPGRGQGTTLAILLPKA